MRGPRIRRVLELSTTHLPAEMMGDDRRAWGGTAGVYPYEYGFLLWVPDSPEESAKAAVDEVPEPVLRIQAYARANDADFVLFDSDAEPDENLPVFDHDSLDEDDGEVCDERRSYGRCNHTDHGKGE